MVIKHAPKRKKKKNSIIESTNDNDEERKKNEFIWIEWTFYEFLSLLLYLDNIKYRYKKYHSYIRSLSFHYKQCVRSKWKLRAAFLCDRKTYRNIQYDCTQHDIFRVLVSSKWLFDCKYCKLLAVYFISQARTNDYGKID